MPIGISTSLLPKNYWSRELENLPFKVVEVNLRSSYLTREEEILSKKIRPALANYDLSVHSRVELFNRKRLIDKAEKATFLVDLWIAENLNAQELVFHVSKFAKKVDFLFLKNACKRFSGKILLENNSKGLFSKIEDFEKLFKKVKKLSFCLDLGHLNVAKTAGYVNSIPQFIENFKDKIEYVHVHWNKGTDTHSVFELNEETKKILLSLKNLDIKKFIIETRTLKEAIRTFYILRKYFN